ncbi:MAG: hypothetical protein HY056_09550 [Proteobacteria bacterium]|nr:hypothetical protein [Pseudomonadota bacterium]
MNLVGEIPVAAPRAAVFAALKNAPFFASLVEGVHDLVEIDATHSQAIFETRIAYMRFRFKVNVAMTRISEPDEIEARIEGTPLGLVGRLTASARTRLSDAAGETLIRYEIEATLTGKLGSIGEPVLKAKARTMEKQFAERLRAAFAAGG